MDGLRFDSFARAFARGASRRQALRALVAVSAAGLWPGRLAVAQGDETCAEGLTDCAGSCVDLQTDMNNCGACGSVCESGLVPVACRGGECVRANCPPELEYCGVVDGCRNLSSDPAHCGACGNVCASGLCENGSCSASAPGGGCQPGQAECDGICVDTCCNNEHCGACGNACEPPLTCFEGQCDCPAGLDCAEGQAVCNCVCVDTCCDNNNCGGCGNVCNPPFTCFEGQCDCPKGDCCAEGEVICDGACVATCCSNEHCGACGNACKPPLTCFEGKCSCPSGNCPPVTPPNTGVGSPVGGSSGIWALLATASASAAVALRRWRGGAETSREEAQVRGRSLTP